MSDALTENVSYLNFSVDSFFTQLTLEHEI